MDIQDSMYSTTADLLALRYSSLSGTTSPCGGSGSLLLSSPWPISSTPSPPSSLSSVSSSTSASSPSSSTCASSLQTINEGTLLSLSSGSPPGHDFQVASPLPTGTRGILEVSSHYDNAGETTVIFTTTGTSSAVGGASAVALDLVDPVSSSSLNGAHAPGKSILCVHEQEHGDLIHFSTSTNSSLLATTTNQLNHVNGNDNRTSATSMLDAASVVDTCKAVATSTRARDFGESGSLAAAPDTDGNLFPTLILTSAGDGSLTDRMIPMRLYASLTSNDVNTGSTTLNSSTIPTTGSNANISGEKSHNSTCILMTTSSNHEDNNGGHNDIHNVLLSGVAHQNHDGAFTLAGFTEQIGDDKSSTNLGTTTILMNECFSSAPNVKDVSNNYGGATCHGKLKDILMNGNIHSRHQLNQRQNLIHGNSDGNGYVLRNLDTTASTLPTADMYDIRGTNGITGTVQQNTRQTIFSLKDEDELKLNSTSGQNFEDAITAIYQDGEASQIMLTGSREEPSSTLEPATYNTDSLITVAQSSSLASPSMDATSSTTTNTVIWSNSGGIVESVGGEGSNGGLLHFVDGTYGQSSFLLKDDIGDLDGIEDDDLLEAKEEVDEDFYVDGEDDGTETKGELKCKFCGFVCCSKSSLGIHERRHTGERPFACKFCGRLFNSAQCCKHHERLHTGDKPFQCSYCGKKYAVSTRLKRHERVHTREEPYKCTECNKTFRWFDAFRDHRNTHTGVPLYLCSVCGKTFTSYLKFYYHERGHLMKKERDRDRLVKQRLANGLAPTTTPWPVKRVYYVKNRVTPISSTIDILKSLQRNSSANIISSLTQQALLVNSMLNTDGGNGKKGGRSNGKSKPQSPKPKGKGGKKAVISH